MGRGQLHVGCKAAAKRLHCLGRNKQVLTSKGQAGCRAGRERLTLSATGVKHTNVASSAALWDHFVDPINNALLSGAEALANAPGHTAVCAVRGLAAALH